MIIQAYTIILQVQSYHQDNNTGIIIGHTIILLVQHWDIHSKTHQDDNTGITLGHTIILLMQHWDNTVYNNITHHDDNFFFFVCLVFPAYFHFLYC